MGSACIHEDVANIYGFSFRGIWSNNFLGFLLIALGHSMYTREPNTDRVRYSFGDTDAGVFLWFFFTLLFYGCLRPSSTTKESNITPSITIALQKKKKI